MSFNDNVYFTGVRGQPGTGQVFFPKDGYTTNAVSGPHENGALPERTYKIKQREASKEKGIKLGDQGYKYRLVGVTEEGEESTVKVKDENGVMKEAVWDPNMNGGKGGWRHSLLIHPDGNGAGTFGCVGIRGTPYAPGARASGAAGSADVQAAAAVDQRLSSGGNNQHLVVKYFDSEADRKKYIDEMKKLHKTPETPQAGPQSQTDKGAKLIQGEPTVMAGPKRRKVGHVGGQCKHTAGGCVVEGSPDVFVGPKRRPLARKQDPTNDGQRVKTGEESVRVD